MTTEPAASFPVLSQHLRREREVHPALTYELSALLQEIALAGKILARDVGRAILTGRVGYTGDVNVQGERVKQLDQWANEVMMNVLRQSGHVCHRTLLEGGIYFYPAEPASEMVGKLRLLYEAAPLGMIVEQAGGKASTGTRRILDLVPGEFHQRVPLFIGSAEEVECAEALHTGARL